MADVYNELNELIASSMSSAAATAVLRSRRANAKEAFRSSERDKAKGGEQRWTERRTHDAALRLILMCPQLT